MSIEDMIIFSIKNKNKNYDYYYFLLNSYSLENYTNEEGKIYRGKNSLIIKCPHCKREFKVLMSSYTKHEESYYSVDSISGYRTYHTKYKSFCNKCKNEFKFITDTAVKGDRK